jgi:hypothetical protein
MSTVELLYGAKSILNQPVSMLITYVHVMLSGCKLWQYCSAAMLSLSSRDIT